MSDTSITVVYQAMSLKTVSDCYLMPNEQLRNIILLPYQAVFTIAS
jgi:hypothetical protein